MLAIKSDTRYRFKTKRVKYTTIWKKSTKIVKEIKLSFFTTNWQNLSAITRVRYIEVLFHIFYYYWSKKIVSGSPRCRIQQLYLEKNHSKPLFTGLIRLANFPPPFCSKFLLPRFIIVLIKCSLYSVSWRLYLFHSNSPVKIMFKFKHNIFQVN